MIVKDENEMNQKVEFGIMLLKEKEKCVRMKRGKKKKFFESRK